MSDQLLGLFFSMYLQSENNFEHKHFEKISIATVSKQFSLQILERKKVLQVFFSKPPVKLNF